MSLEILKGTHNAV